MKAALQFVLVVCIATLARATSVVAKVGEDKIVVAADTLGIDAEGTRHEDQRKIVPLGKYVFAGGINCNVWGDLAQFIMGFESRGRSCV